MARTAYEPNDNPPKRGVKLGAPTAEAGAEHFPLTAFQDEYDADAENLAADVSACECRMHER